VLYLIKKSLEVIVLFVLIFYSIGYLYYEGWKLVNFFKKFILFVVPCVSGFIEFYYLFLFPDFKGVNKLCWLLFH